MRLRVAVSVMALATLVGRIAEADDDLDRIPKEVLEEPKAAPEPAKPEARATFEGKLFAEDAFTVWSAPRDVPVPYPSPLSDWQNRSSVDATFRWKPWRPLSITLSDRVDVLEQGGTPSAKYPTIRNALREGYATWQPAENVYLEAGRINVRGGVALGYNPTDFFKTRTLVGQASLDPSVLRQNRLGTLMSRGQAIWKGGSATFAFAPKVAEPSSILATRPGFDPRFDATNGAHRFLSTLSFDVFDISAEILGYFELRRSRIGLELSRPFGDAVVAYGEWAGGPEANLITRALDDARATGALPLRAPSILPTDPAIAFRNDVSAGFSWTIAARLTVNAEYHFHQGGFTRDDWRRWFATGSGPRASAASAGALWLVRGYANDQEEPVPIHQLFVRLSWPRAIVTDLELAAFSFVDLMDGSALAQLSASYYISDTWTASAYVSANLGDSRTERGSFPQRVSGIVEITGYLWR